MKNTYHKILSVIMAIMVLISTTSFLLDAHFCGDKLVDLSFIQQANSCHKELNHNQDNCETKISKSNCCTDVQVLNQGQDVAQQVASNLTLEQQYLIVSFVISYQELFNIPDSDIITFKNYRPPILVWEIQKIQETYLI